MHIGNCPILKKRLHHQDIYLLGVSFFFFTLFIFIIMWTWECECVENKNVEKKNVRNLWFTSFSFVLAALVIIFFPFLLFHPTISIEMVMVVLFLLHYCYYSSVSSIIFSGWIVTFLHSIGGLKWMSEIDTFMSIDTHILTHTCKKRWMNNIVYAVRCRIRLLYTGEHF